MKLYQVTNGDESIMVVAENPLLALSAAIPGYEIEHYLSMHPVGDWIGPKIGTPVVVVRQKNEYPEPMTAALPQPEPEAEAEEPEPDSAGALG